MSKVTHPPPHVGRSPRCGIARIVGEATEVNSHRRSVVRHHLPQLLTPRTILTFIPKRLQFEGYSRRIWPTILAGSAPGIGSNFCTRPAKQSAT